VERRLRIVFPLAAGFVLAVQAASAQEASLADFLVTQASCTSSTEARASLEQALGLTPPDTSRDAILQALRQVASRDDLCTELRDAAGAFADQVVAPAAPPEAEAEPEVEPPTSPTPSELVVAALVEAERRAANLTFEVAPPPRFMTRERNPGR
jgi:hypothetical protein